MTVAACGLASHGAAARWLPTWLPPAPVLFQRRIGAEDRAIPAATIRKILTAALARTGLTGPAPRYPGGPPSSG